MKKPITSMEYRALADSHRNALRQSWITFFKTGVFTISAVIALFVLSAAWFANNNVVKSKGMNIQAESTSNLVISNDEDKIKLINLSDTSSVVHFSDYSDLTLTPSTNNWSLGNATGLIYNTNPGFVSSKSGMEDGSGHALKFAPVPTTGNGQYYVDYTVYIASYGKPLEVESLVVEMLLENKDSNNLDPINDYANAFSIDFYIGEPLSSTYVGTLNQAGKDNTNNGEVKSSLELLNNSTIPLNTEDSIKITMRCYFDGALQKDIGNKITYVRSHGLKLSDYSLKVSFIANDAL